MKYNQSEVERLKKEYVDSLDFWLKTGAKHSQESMQMALVELKKYHVILLETRSPTFSYIGDQ